MFVAVAVCLDEDILSNVVTEAEEEPWKGCPSRWLQRGRCDALDVNMTKKRGPINAATPKC
jgi:hypothetical protein